MQQVRDRGVERMCQSQAGEKEQDPQRVCRQPGREDEMCEQSQALGGGRGDGAS